MNPGLFSGFGRAAGIRSIQRGAIGVTTGGGMTGSSTATITPVNVAKSVIEFLGVSGNDGNAVAGRVALTNSTTVTASVNAAAVGVVATVGYQVTEYF